MHRSRSMTSLFTMSQFPCANSPYEIFSQPSPFDNLPDGSQPFDPQWHAPGEESDTPSSEYSSEDPPQVMQDSSKGITFTNTEELRSVLATLSNYNHGQLGNHLKSCRGCIILPLDAVTALRTPRSNHCLTYPCLVFFPTQSLDNYTESLPNFVESIGFLYNNQ